MWKNYSRSYIKYNRASSISVMAAVLAAAMFLSLLCSISYNFWTYEVEKIVLEEGGWQGRITGRLRETDLSVIQNFANVERVEAREELSGKDSGKSSGKGGAGNEDTVADIYFQNARTIYQDLPLIAAQLGLGEDSIEYHSLLLSRYFIHDPQDEDPPLLLAFYLGILVMVSVSLILIIRGSFELSMNARIHQFGIFSSIGATPGQIRLCLLQEALALSAAPVVLGILLGIGESFGLIKVINIITENVAGRHESAFQYHPLIFAITMLSSALTVLFSAWVPAWRLSRMTPLEAIRGADVMQLKKKKHSRLLSMLFGIKGELAGNALKAQRKSLRISTASLLLSFLGFSMMLCFTTLSGISTRYTYFERYQDAWDVMITLKNTALADFGLTEELRAVPGAGEVTVYQKAEAEVLLSEELQSADLKSLGGLHAVAGKTDMGSGFQVEAPVLILDDASFFEYCSNIGVTPDLKGAVVLNQIWDSVNSNFRYREYVPFVKEDRRTTSLSSPNGETVEIPVLGYTQTAPVLREEYQDYALVHVLPLALWKETAGLSEGLEADSYVRMFSGGDASLADLNALEKEAVQLLGQEYEAESENRVQEKLSNDRMMRGMVMIFGAFCVLLAIIGTADVFSNTLSFLRQRKREFAQYMSVGLTPQEMRKIFWIEAFVIAGRPLLITFPLTVLFVQAAVKASCLEPAVFWAEAPVLPIFVFAAAVVFFVGLAYYIGGKRLLKCDLSEALRNDALT